MAWANADLPKYHLRETDETKALLLHDLNWGRVLEHYISVEQENIDVADNAEMNGVPRPPQKLLYIDGIEVVRIPGNDPRIGLRGQMGLFVKQGYCLPAHTVLGPYCGIGVTESELQFSLPKDLQHERYRYEFAPILTECLPENASDKMKEMLTELVERCVNDGGGLEGFRVDGLFPGNVLAAINDCRFDPASFPQGSTKDGTRNVMFVEVLYNGWPYVFMVTTADVVGGDELLVDYGVRYWEGHRFVMQTAELVKTVQTGLTDAVQKLDPLLKACKAAKLRKLAHSTQAGTWSAVGPEKQQQHNPTPDPEVPVSPPSKVHRLRVEHLD